MPIFPAQAIASRTRSTDQNKSIDTPSLSLYTLKAPALSTSSLSDEHDDDDEHEEAQIVEQPVMHSIQTIQPVSVSQQNISKARLVTVAKRVAPKLPPRNPNRGGKGPIVIDASPTGSPREASPDTSDRLSSRASHRSISPPSSTAHGSLTKGMEEIKLDDEDDEIEQRNPWAKVQEQRKSEEAEREKRKGRESMPGGFD